MRKLTYLLLALSLSACQRQALRLAPTWQADGEARQNAFGRRAMGAGDINGDGYGDLAVGAPDFDQHRGKVLVYCGSAKGLGAEPCWSAMGAGRGDQFGDRVGQAGDVNGDGYDDLFVAIPSWKGGPGRCEVFLGGPQGLGAKAAWAVTPPGGEREQFGDCTHPTGDVNGDGYDDLLVGAYQALSSSGRALLYLGGPKGLGREPVWQGRGEAEGDQYGYTLSSAGDLNGDGYGDVIIGAKFHDASKELGLSPSARALAGKAYIYEGSLTGLSPLAHGIIGDVAGARLSVRSYGIGDVDADGVPDLLVSEPGRENGLGAVGIYRGSELRLRRKLLGRHFGLTEFGQAAGPAGDFNGDGYDDVIIAGRRADHGTALLFFGGPQGIGAGADVIIQDREDSLGFATWVAPAGDLNGDGLDDVVIAAERSSAKLDLAGRVWVLYGQKGASKETRIMRKLPAQKIYLTKKVH